MGAVHDKGKPAARRGRKTHGPSHTGGSRAAERSHPRPQRSLMLMLTLISAELWCALLWALTGAMVASAVALLLGCGVVLASYLSGP